MARTPYNGTSRKLVLAFDIGTAYSGAAYAFLDPGLLPQINSVTKFLGNPNAGATKVPSILYYNQDGSFHGVENGTGLQEDEELLQLRWWKLMLGPIEPNTVFRDMMPRELPKGKTIVGLFSDFMRYLFDSTKEIFISADKLGEQRWNSLAGSLELVLSHPNGWGGPQQNNLRAAAVGANIIPDTPEGRARVHFVTEGEASFNFCITHTPAGESLKLGEKVLVVDAGGGTIDISSYVVTKEKPLQVEELFQPTCLLQGGEFVTARAREAVSERMRKSKFNTAEDITVFAQKFDEGLKKVFSDDKGTQFVKFGSLRDNDPSCGIKSGKLTLTGKQVAGFFEPSVQSTVDFILENFSENLQLNSSAFLVGGFASSPWLTSQLNHRLSDIGLKFFKPDANTDKAVAVGAISFYLDCFVRGRISKFTYGVPCFTRYNPLDPEHVKRQHKALVDPLGHKYLPGSFKTMLSKGTIILEDREIRRRVHTVRTTPSEKDVLGKVMKYSGSQLEPRWMDIELDRFETLCHIVADISAPFTPKLGPSGKVCYHREFDVVLLVGFTELKAQIRWIDSVTGKEKSGNAAIVYSDPSENNSSSEGNENPPPSYDEFNSDS